MNKLINKMCAHSHVFVSQYFSDKVIYFYLDNIEYRLLRMCGGFNEDAYYGVLNSK
jgi:hypothetical protein